jgi:pimeloyl-ACP methyl ester carboxylesterase
LRKIIGGAVRTRRSFYTQAPRSWTERAYHNLIHFNALAKGGHFAAWEQPQLFSEEVRAGFRSLRK